jgi:hypothetical protein
MQKEMVSDESFSDFPILFGKEEFKKAILETMLVLIQKTNLAFAGASADECSLNEGRVWSLLSSKSCPTRILYEPAADAADIDLDFAEIEHLSMVVSLMQLYDYGVHGILDTSLGGDFDSFDGYENQVARILYDLDHSTFLEEWGNYGVFSNAIAVKKCAYVYELANARLMLEGSVEGFFLDDREAGFLSVRQLALLSGMTEASIRTLASRSKKEQVSATGGGNSQLITTNDGKNTSIDIHTAKEWLKAKGRYVSIVNKQARGLVDFTTRRHESTRDIEDAIFDRIEYLKEQLGEDLVDARIESAGVVRTLQPVSPDTDIARPALGQAQLLNTELMHRLAEALEMPANLFALRVAEAVMQDKVREIEKQLKQVQQSK